MLHGRHSGHAALTLLLLEKMLSNGPGRIVNVIRCAALRKLHSCSLWHRRQCGYGRIVSAAVDEMQAAEGLGTKLTAQASRCLLYTCACLKPAIPLQPG
jgi:hypothetical protein